jgi:hypothetical protein
LDENIKKNFILYISAPIVVQHVAKNLNSKVHRGSLKTIKFLFLGYPRPRAYAERLDQLDSYWRNYTGYLPVLGEDVYWTVEVRRNLTCADTGLIRLVILDENMRHVVNVMDRTPLIGRCCNIAGKTVFHCTYHVIEPLVHYWWVSVLVMRQTIVIDLQTCKNI